MKEHPNKLLPVPEEVKNEANLPALSDGELDQTSGGIIIVGGKAYIVFDQNRSAFAESIPFLPEIHNQTSLLKRNCNIGSVGAAMPQQAQAKFVAAGGAGAIVMPSGATLSGSPSNGNTCGLVDTPDSILVIAVSPL